MSGSLFFFFLFIARIAQGLHGDVTAWLLASQSGLVSFRILFRKKSKTSSLVPIRLMAWLSALAPLSMITTVSSLLALPGIVLSIWSLLAIGASFSISPCDRGLVQRGPYRIIRHPMYTGELFSLVGTCVSNPLIWNWIVLIAFVATVYLRIAVEESAIEGYPQYAKVVVWRLVPYVW